MNCLLCDKPRRRSLRGSPPHGNLCWPCRRAARRYLDLPRAVVLRLLDAARRRGDTALVAQIGAALDPRFLAELDTDRE